MDWEAIGAIGEILGALAVVATLFYLARQMQQNAVALERSNDFAQASSIRDSNTDHIQIFLHLSHNRDLADVYNRALSGEALDGTEAVRFTAFVNAYFGYMETALVQLNRDLLHDEFNEMDSYQAFNIGYPYWGRMLNTEAGKDWWENEAPYQFSGEFLDLIDKIRVEKETSLGADN